MSISELNNRTFDILANTTIYEKEDLRQKAKHKFLKENNEKLINEIENFAYDYENTGSSLSHYPELEQFKEEYTK